GVELWMIVVLHPVVLVPQSVVECKSWIPLEAVLRVDSPVTITEAAGKIWIDEGRIQTTSPSYNQRIGVGIAHTRELALGKDGLGVLHQIAVHQIVQSLGRIGTEYFGGLGKGAECAVDLL